MKGQGKGGRSKPINAKAVQDTTVRHTKVGGKAPAADSKRLPVKVAPPDRQAYTGPPSSKSTLEGIRATVDKAVRKTPVVGTIIEKLDEVTRKMGR